MYAIERNVARIGSLNYKGTYADKLTLINSMLDLCRRGSRNYFHLLLQRRNMILSAGYDKDAPGARIEYLQKVMKDSNELMYIRPKKEVLQDSAKSAENAYLEALLDTAPRKPPVNP